MKSAALSPLHSSPTPGSNLLHCKLIRWVGRHADENATTFSRRFSPVQLTVIHTAFIHWWQWLLMQGANLHIRSSLGFSILPKDTSTWRPGESIQRTSDNKMLALSLSPSCTTQHMCAVICSVFVMVCFSSLLWCPTGEHSSSITRKTLATRAPLKTSSLNNMCPPSTLCTEYSLCDCKPGLTPQTGPQIYCFQSICMVDFFSYLHPVIQWAFPSLGHVSV